MKVKSVFYVFAIAFLFTSCGFHNGAYMSSASIGESNFTVTKTVFGQAKTTKIFGIGGLGKDALVADARASLLRKYPLKENQILANVSVDFKSSFFFIVSTNMVTVTADIVEFDK